MVRLERMIGQDDWLKETFHRLFGHVEWWNLRETELSKMAGSKFRQAGK